MVDVTNTQNSSGTDFLSILDKIKDFVWNFTNTIFGGFNKLIVDALSDYIPANKITAALAIIYMALLYVVIIVAQSLIKPLKFIIAIVILLLIVGLFL